MKNDIIDKLINFSNIFKQRNFVVENETDENWLAFYAWIMSGVIAEEESLKPISVQKVLEIFGLQKSKKLNGEVIEYEKSKQ